MTKTKTLIAVSGGLVAVGAAAAYVASDLEAFKPTIKRYAGPVLSLAEPAPKTASPSQLAAVEKLQIFPKDNPWNTPVDDLLKHPLSMLFIESIGEDAKLHPDFGVSWRGKPIGIPFDVSGPEQKKVDVTFRYADESDPGPYPIPPDATIEGGPDGEGDRHVIVVDPLNRKLYELFRAFPQPDGSWEAGSGAIFDLTRNDLRPKGWTSADAAGLPIFPGLVRYEEVKSGEIDHALRFTVKKTRKAYISPAVHYASRSTERTLPPMGLRVRLKADYDISGFPPQAQVILKALKKYGMILADNGGNWFLSGSPDQRWDMDAVESLKRIRGEDFEVVDTGPASDE
ncbi:MAG: hypothetical protein H0T47_18745 [Planctomycetaceae bacterium]|nr:hypothetical protein [Planctomycetaceae bacterium]